MTRRGIGLAEVLVAASLASVVFMVAWTVYHTLEKSRGSTALANAVLTAALAEDRIKHDLARLLLVGPSPVKVAERRLAFYTYDTGSGRKVVAQGVVYSLPSPRGFLMRRIEGGEHQIGVAPLESISFHPFLSPTGPLLRVALTVGRAEGDPEGRPIHHTFLARIAAPRTRTKLDLDLRTPLPAADEPDTVLPVIGEPVLPRR